MRTSRPIQPGRTKKHKVNKVYNLRSRALTHGYNLRSKGSVEHMFLQLHESLILLNKIRVNKLMVDIYFTQMGYKKGVKLHGDVAIKPTISEIQQLDDKRVFEPVLASCLTPEQKRLTLRAITLIQEKNCGIKGRTVADGRTQRGYVSKEESVRVSKAQSALLYACIYILLFRMFCPDRIVATHRCENIYIYYFYYYYTECSL